MLGSGGVGKTTTSVGLAILAASMGRRVAVLSIDPSKRLAKALGFKLTATLQKLDLPFLENCEGGEIYAAVVDQKKIFDEVVQKYGKNQGQIDAILAHPLYQAASSNLSGPIEYMSLAKFGELASDPYFDLVVLDTPPDNNALEFLARPNVLAGFIDKKIMKWLIKPFALAGKFGVSRLLTIGEKMMGGLAKITGVSMLSQFANFLVLMQEVIEGFHSVGTDVLKILSKDDTGFFMVVSAAEDRLAGFNQFKGQLEEMGYSISGLFANKCLPSDVCDDLYLMSEESMTPHVENYWERLQLQKSILASLSSMSLNDNKFEIFKITDMIGAIDNLDSFSQYIKNLEKL